MSVLYAVRSRFIDPAREDEWNDWYAGHIDVLLGVPGFLSAQRFHSSETPDDRPYLALYEVASQDVFTSEPYLAIWGFDDWRPLIDNWTRDLFERREGEPFDFATPSGARLSASFVSGDDHAVQQTLAAMKANRCGVSTAAAVGLDGSCGGIAWAVLSGGEQPVPEAVGPAVDVTRTIYNPFTEYLTEPREVAQ
jgi:hypothetical protein